MPKESSPNSNPSHLQPRQTPYRGPLLPEKQVQTRPITTTPERIPSSFRLRSLASYPRLALCQRNPLPTQIPPTYIHSQHPTEDHSSQETGTRQNPCPHAPELKPPSLRLRSLASYPRPALCQRNRLPIQIPPTYSHSHHPTGDHSSQRNRFQTRPMFTCTRADPLES